MFYNATWFCSFVALLIVTVTYKQLLCTNNFVPAVEVLVTPKHSSPILPVLFIILDMFMNIARILVPSCALTLLSVFGIICI